MKYLWILIVLCATSAFGQNSYGTDFINLHCTAPDPNAPPNFGDQPRPGLVPLSAATGNMVIYCDAASGALKSSVNGSVYGSVGGAATGAVYAASLGVKADGHIVFGPSFTNTSNIVTCSGCNFTGTDAQNRPNAVVGQVVFGTNAFSDVSALTSVLVTPECVIQSIDSATQIHMGTFGSIGTACNATGTTNGTTGYIAWGDLDSANASGAQTLANDPLFNAWTAAANNCQALILPSGVMLVERGEFDTNSTGACSNGNQTTFLRAGYSVYGQGPAATIIVPTPNFRNLDCSFFGGCFFAAAANFHIQDLQLTGLGNSACGSGFNGDSLITIAGSSANTGTNFSLRHVIFQGWCAAQTGVAGVTLGVGANTISGGLISDSIIETFGFTGTVSNYGTNSAFPMIQVTNDQFTGCGNGGCLTILGGKWSSSHTFYGFSASTTQNSISFGTGVEADFYGDYMGYATGAGVGEIGCTGCTLSIDGTIVNNPTGGAGALTFGAGTNKIIMKGSNITGILSDFACNGSGVICNSYDLGGNIFGAGGVSATSGGVYNQWQTSSITGTACATGNFALTSGWGTSTVASASGDSHRCHMTITGAAGAAGPVLTWTYPKAYLVAPFSCQLTGTNASLTGVSTTSLTATSTAFTFTGTPVAVTYTFDISCGP